MAIADEERALVDRFLADRDERAFREIYRQHCPALYGFARNLLERDVAVEDIVQEAWLRAVRRLPSFDGRSSLRTWLIGFVVNCCRESWRDARRHGTEQVADDLRKDAAQPAESHAEKLDLERALARLAPGYRTVLLLHDLQGMTHEEIGELLEIAPGTSKSQLARARQVLRSLWAMPVRHGGEDGK
ncbi:MAG TPA: RNA polymerase sigma factor [Terriglobia bacterium]|nr:RNA polymerase sigma factor [Terriglobia bacterium]